MNTQSGHAGRLVAAAAAALVGLSLLVAPATAPAAAPAGDVVVWGGTAAAVAAAVEHAGGDVERPLPLIGGVAADVDTAAARRLRAAGYSVVADVALELADHELGHGTPIADHHFAATNPGGDWDLAAGAGVAVALVDTGVTEVADLQGRVVQALNLTDEATHDDSYGHGTFMAGLIAGDGTSSAQGPVRHVGIAPSADIVSIKVAGRDGETTLGKLLEGIGWVVEHADQHNIRVLNLSVAVPPLSATYAADPLSFAVEAAWASGITVVAASGNDGTYVSSPGRDPWVLTVGALDVGSELGMHDDSVPSWSGREVTRWGAKPELLAPGVSVVSLAAPGSTVVTENPGSVVDGVYLHGSGTSMAAAIAAGAVAVLTEHHAAATPDDYKAALVATGHALPGTIGRVMDLAAADLAEAGAPSAWWQRHPVAANGLGVGLSNGMPWTAPDVAGSRWAGSRWAGSRWAGSRWVDHAWTGSRWANEAFAGSRWAGSRWAGSRWAGSRWAGSRWAGSRWAESLWAGSRWAGSRWAGEAFVAGSRWAGSRWAGSRWAGSRWAGGSWTGSRWAGSRWAGSRWADSLWR